MEQSLKSKYMAITLKDYCVYIEAFDSRPEAGDFSFSPDHTIEGGYVEITDNEITINGIEYFRYHLLNATLKDAVSYEYSNDDIEDRSWHEHCKHFSYWKYIFGFDSKMVLKTEKYLKRNYYTKKKRRDFHMVSNMKWVLKYSNGEVLSSEAIA